MGWKGGLMTELTELDSQCRTITAAQQDPCTHVHIASSLTHIYVIRNKILNS